MVLDARQTNAFHKAPPFAAMTSPGVMASMVVDDAWDGKADFNPASLVAGSVDLCDGLYQSRCKRMGSWFGINFPGCTANGLGISTVYDEATGKDEAIGPDEFVWPCFEALPMGWSWALWVCHETPVDCMAVAARPGDTFALNRSVAATISPDSVVHAPYVDNASLMGMSTDTVDDRLDRVTDELTRRGFRWHEHNKAQGCLEVLGMVVDGAADRLRHKPRRAWRLYRALGFSSA